MVRFQFRNSPERLMLPAAWADAELCDAQKSVVTTVEAQMYC